MLDQPYLEKEHLPASNLCIVASVTTVTISVHIFNLNEALTVFAVCVCVCVKHCYMLSHESYKHTLMNCVVCLLTCGKLYPFALYYDFFDIYLQLLDAAIVIMYIILYIQIS